MFKIVPIHSHLTEEEEAALLKKAKLQGVNCKKDAVRLAIQHYIECDISEPNAFYEKLKRKMKEE